MNKRIAITFWFKPFLIVIACFTVTKFLVEDYPFLLVMSLLFLPFLDLDRKSLKFSNEIRSIKKYWWLFLIALPVLFFIYPSHTEYIVQTIFIVALPEEWFFRAYLLTRFGGDNRANIASSVVFSLLHMISRGPMIGLMVFVPSLFYGWVFQKSRSLTLCIFAHAISNMFFVLVFERYIGEIKGLL